MSSLSNSSLSSFLKRGFIEQESESSHHCVDSFAGPLSSDIGGTLRASNQLDSAPLPPRMCSVLEKVESNAGSATGLISGEEGCSSTASKGLMETCIERVLMSSMENEFVPCPELHSW